MRGFLLLFHKDNKRLNGNLLIRLND